MFYNIRSLDIRFVFPIVSFLPSVLCLILLHRLSVDSPDGDARKSRRRLVAYPVGASGLNSFSVRVYAGSSIFILFLIDLRDLNINKLLFLKFTSEFFQEKDVYQTPFCFKTISFNYILCETQLILI